MRHKIDMELRVEEVRRSGNHLKIGDKEYNLSHIDIRKRRITKELKNAECNDLEYMLFRMELTYSQIEYTFYMKYIDASTTWFTIAEGIYEISDLNLMLKSLIPEYEEVNIMIVEFKQRSSLTTQKTVKNTKIFFSTQY